jgi:hypothetical protein
VQPNSSGKSTSSSYIILKGWLLRWPEPTSTARQDGLKNRKREIQAKFAGYFLNERERLHWALLAEHRVWRSPHKFPHITYPNML